MNNRIYLCIDLKTFFASVECVERRLDPFKTDLVVADSSRGNGAICLAISPKMKERGIRNRCRIFEIPRNVKYIVAIPRMKKYIEYSANIYGIYLKYIDKDDIHVYSIDEAFLDVTTYLKLYNKTPYELAKMIMKDILDTTGITATAGIGTNLYLTKIALDITAKHVDDHIGYLDEEKYKEELWHHKPLTDFWQIGRGINNRLNNLGIYDMYDIAHTKEEILYKEFGINAKLIIDHANGIEPCMIKEIKAYKPKTNSFSNNQILFEDYKYNDARMVLIEMIDSACLELVKKGLYTSYVSYYIGYSKDTIPSLGSTKKLEQPSNNFKHIKELLLEDYDKKIDKKYLIRRLGVSFGELTTKKYEQLDIFLRYQEEEQDEKIESTMANIKNKFGKNAILRGISLDEKATQIKRNKLIGGHNAE